MRCNDFAKISAAIGVLCFIAGLIIVATHKTPASQTAIASVLTLMAASTMANGLAYFLKK